VHVKPERAQVVEGWYSPALQDRTTATQQYRFKTFPKVRPTFGFSASRQAGQADA
jgi:hypothetical protein